MKKEITQTIGVMDPNSLSFRMSIEKLVAHLKPKIHYQDKIHTIKTRRIICRPYNTLGAKSSCSAIINRGAHWNPHHNSFFMMIMHKVYLLNDMISFNAIDKNTAYGQMHSLGLRIPRTWALPQQDNSELLNNKNVNPNLVFSEYEMFDLKKIGEEVGYPSYLKPQDGGGWLGVERIENPEQLAEKYNNSGDRPMNLQQAIDYQEFVRTVGVGPQMFPMHYNPNATISHERYLRDKKTLIDPNFINEEETKEITQITKIINAFYGWDHNSCEVLIDKKGECYPIDYANAYPDSTLISLHYYFPDLVKAMVRWLIFVVVTGKQKRVDFAYNWERYFKIAEKAKKEEWEYSKKLAHYEKLADEHFGTHQFEEFQEKYLADFDEKSLEFFESDEFLKIIHSETRNYFRYPWEVPSKIEHYEKLHKLWIKNEKEKLFPQNNKVKN